MCFLYCIHPAALTWHWRWQRGLRCRIVLLVATPPAAGRWAGWAAWGPASLCCWSAGTPSRPAASAAHCSWNTGEKNRRVASQRGDINNRSHRCKCDISFLFQNGSNGCGGEHKRWHTMKWVVTHLRKGAGRALARTNLETPFNRHIQAADHTGRHHGCRSVQLLSDALR